MSSDTCRVCGERVPAVEHAAKCPRSSWAEQDPEQNRADHWAEPEQAPRGEI